MKKLIVILLFAAVNTVLRASDIPVTYSTNSKWIIIDNEKWKSPSLNVTIRSTNGTIILNEKMNKITKYNLKYVGEGDYTLELEDNQTHKI